MEEDDNYSANMTFQVNTNSFRTHEDFDLFVNSLERTYCKVRRSREQINEDYEYFSDLQTPSPEISQIWECDSSPEGKDEIVVQTPKLTKSFLNIFDYFDQDVTVNLDEIGEHNVAVVEEKKTGSVQFAERPTAAPVLNKTVGKLNRDLLKVFESTEEKQEFKTKREKVVRNFPKSDVKDKSFIESINELFTTYRKNENGDKSMVVEKPKDAHKPVVVEERLKTYDELVKALERHENRRFDHYKQSTMKPHQTALDISGSLSSINTNTSEEEDIDSGIQSKTLSPNRNDAFFDQKSVDSLESSFSGEGEDNLKISGIFEVSPDDSLSSELNEAEAQHSKMKDIIMQNKLVKLENSSLLFEIDKILNECKLSLIQMILELINENVFMNNEIELMIDLLPDYCAFIQAFTMRAYQIDTVKTTSPCENCVAVEIAMFDKSMKHFLRVLIVFDIRSGQSAIDLRDLYNEFDFKIVVGMYLKVPK
jgi:hypothetical protein